MGYSMPMPQGKQQYEPQTPLPPDYFPTEKSLDDDERLERMRRNCALDLPRLKIQNQAEKTPISVVCYGPSLVDTWQHITHPVMTCSGAHDFLIERGIVPNWHVEYDPRPHKAKFLQRPHPEVTYCISSACAPEVFSALRGHKVLMWHAADEPIVNQIHALVRKHDAQGGVILGGGSNVGLRCLSVAYALGWRVFNVHALDCSYRGAQQWAGEHHGKPHYVMEIETYGRVFHTSDVMMNAAMDFKEITRIALGCTFHLWGDGMLQHILKSEQAEAEEQQRIAAAARTAVV